MSRQGVGPSGGVRRRLAVIAASAVALSFLFILVVSFCVLGAYYLTRTPQEAVSEPSTSTTTSTSSTLAARVVQTTSTEEYTPSTTESTTSTSTSTTVAAKTCGGLNQFACPGRKCDKGLSVNPGGRCLSKNFNPFMDKWLG
jgi:hypothetical protein